MSVRTPSLPRFRSIAVYRTKSIVCILKCRIYYHSYVARPMDQEKSVIEKIVCFDSKRRGQVAL